MRHRVATHARRLGRALLLLALAAGRADAQRTLRTIGTDLGHGVSDMLYVWSAPARADARDLAGVGLAAAIVLGAGVADRDLQRWMVEHPSSAVMRGLRPFREEHDASLVDLGSAQRIQPAMGALYLVGFAANSRALRDAAVGCASAQQAETLLHTLTLELVQRERPLTANGDAYDVAWGSGPWERHAFFSGHAANIMSCVSYWNARFQMGAAEPALYALALGIGVARMADQRHWASDVATGSVLGYAIGRTVGRRARKRAERADRGEDAPMRTGMLDHAYVTGGGGVTVGWRRTF
jgi:membrane-associated phospholipid phosphatase